MKLYGKKIVKNYIEKKTKASQETRDAILWDVQTENKTCRIKIQGSNTLIIAHYPRNWKSIPYWLKRGNSVRILHRGGNRGYVEVTGEGRAIPTPVSGGTFPDEETLPDTIVSGCVMSATDVMGVRITSGTYRIDGTVYILDVTGQYILYDSGTYTLFDSEPYEFFQPDDGTILKYIDPAPSVGSFRYDAFCVGIDGVIDYIKGIASTTPEKPLIPANHVLIGSYILVLGGVTVIGTEDIGRIWSTPYASVLYINIESSGMSYDMPYETGETIVEASIAITIKDQFNNNYSAESCSAVITKNTGGGTLSPLSVTFTAATTLKWERDQTSTDDNVPMVFTVDGTIDGKLLTSIGIIIPQPEVI